MERRLNWVIFIYLLDSSVRVNVLDCIYATEMQKLRISKKYIAHLQKMYCFTCAIGWMGGGTQSSINAVQYPCPMLHAACFAIRVGNTTSCAYHRQKALPWKAPCSVDLAAGVTVFPD
jgi:hypothetical protein